MKTNVTSKRSKVKRNFTTKARRHKAPDILCSNFGGGLLWARCLTRSRKFFFTVVTAMLFITLLLTGIAAANPCLQSITASAVINNTTVTFTKGLRCTPVASPVLFSQNAAFSVQRIEIKRCPILEAESTNCDSASWKIKPAQSDGLCDISNTVWWFSLKREGLADLPGPSFILLDAWLGHPCSGDYA